MKDDFGNRSGITYDLGRNLLDFLWFDLNSLDGVYTDLYAYMLFPDHEKSNDAYRDRLFHFIDQIDLYCLYLHFYTQALLRFIEESAIQRMGAYSDLLAFTEDGPEYCDDEELYKDNDKLPFLPTEILQRLNSLGISPLESGPFIDLLKESDNAKRILLEDIRKKRIVLHSELDEIMVSNEVFDGKEALQELFLIDSKRSKRGEKPFYIGHTFHSEYLPAHMTIPNLEELFEWNIDYKKADIVQMYEINSVNDLIRFELLNLIDKEVVIKKCPCCGYYFIPVGRSDTKYCERKKKKGDKSCKEIGAMQKYKEKIANDKIQRAYDIAYKRNYSRARNKKMTQQDFNVWSQMASKMRDDCHAEIISFEDYQRWLDQTRKKSRK
jgi:hypothetical protein